MRFLMLLVVITSWMCLGAVGQEKRTAPRVDSSPRQAAPVPRSKSNGKTDGISQSDIDTVAAVKDSAKRFAVDYNKHDPKAAASGFALTAEFITENGTTIRGRDAIERHFATVFSVFPQAHLELQFESVHMVTSNVAIEEGQVEFTISPETPIETSRYVAVHVYEDGRWLLVRTRDFSADAAPRNNHERLHELEWLVGEWMEEEEDSLIATSCRWSNDRNYLLQEFTIRVGGQPPVTGSTRIGWDPLTRQIKSWTFDSDGGYSEALWTRGTSQWILKSRGVTHLGRNHSGTSILRHVDSSTLSWETRDRVEGGALVADRGPLLVKRRPPTAGE
jgi:uncharacterized protein (TIGR02246 family)